MKTAGCLLVAIGMAAMSSNAETYYFTGTSDYADYTDVANWLVGGPEGTAATTIPGSSDALYTLSPIYADMAGGDYSVGSWGFSADWNHSPKPLYVRNGTLRITSNLTTHSGTLVMSDGGNIYVEGTYVPAIWDGGAHVVTVNDGCTYGITGSYQLYKTQVTVNSGGEFLFNPTAFSVYGGSAQSSWYDIYGTMDAPSGVKWTSGSLESDSCVIDFRLRDGGVMRLGSGFAQTPSTGKLKFTWYDGGTLAATGAVTFVNTDATIVDNASVFLEIGEGGSIDFSGMSIGTGVTVTKAGVGDFVFSNGMTLPDVFTVSEGSLLLSTAGSYDISSVAFSANAKIKLGASGIVLSAFDSSIHNATFGLGEGYVPAYGAAILTCSDATVLANAQSGLNASLAGTGVSVKTVGNSLVAESHYTFSSSSVTDMNDTAGWVNGIAATAGQPATVSGSSTAAVMDGTVPAYSAISVEDGASLTIVATRDLPATTLAAGTALAVTSSVETVVMENRSYSGYIMDTDTLVGTMSPSRSLSEIADIVGIRGGGWFGERSDPYTYVNVKVADAGAKLRVQFIYNDSDWTKCAIVEFTKDAQGNIYAKGVGAGYVSPTSEQVDFDEIEYTAATYGTSNSSGAYGVKNLTFKAPVIHGGLSTVTAVGDFETTGSGSVTVDVAEDCVLDLSGVDVTTAATLVKTGDGAITFGDELPTALNVTEGVLVLLPYVEYDMSSITVAGGVETKVLVGGECKDAVAFVQPNGNTVFMSSGVYVGVGTWATAANWVNSEIPDASTAAHIYGADTVLTIDNDSITMPASISVEGGATLRVLADVTLPPLAIDSTSKVVFGDNTTTVSAILDPLLITVADAAATPVALPVIEIETNATVTIGGDMKFKNVDFRLYGKLSKSSVSVKGPTFGYAANGETSYIAFTADGGEFDIHAETGSEPSLGQINFLCPESGGIVVAVGTITLKNSTHEIKGWNDMGNVRFGYGNATTAAFNVLLDGTHLDISGAFNAGGAAHLVLVNGSYIRRATNCLGHGFNMAISDAATVDVGEGCYIHFATSAGSFGIDSQAVVDAVTVRDGGIYSVTANSSGWTPARAVFASDDGILGVHGIYDSRARTDLLRGFASARLDGSLFIKSVDIYTGGGHYTNNLRHAKMANIPFVGAGDVTVTNGVPAHPFTVTMVNGANTATGSIKVAKAAGDAETALYFGDGANWAGTVVAGNVALTNLTDGATAARVAFGGLSLPRGSTFPVRVWSDGAGGFAGDVVDVGTYAGNGGRLTPVNMTPGVDFASGDTVVVGKISKTSPLPRPSRGWVATTRPIDGDDANEMLVLVRGRGYQVILK